MWGTASKTKVNIIQRFKNKINKQILHEPKFVPNGPIHKDSGISIVIIIFRDSEIKSNKTNNICAQIFAQIVHIRRFGLAET